MALSVNAVTFDTYTFFPSDCVKISSSLNERKIRPKDDRVIYLNIRKTAMAKSQVNIKNDSLLSIGKPTNFMAGIPGMPRGPLVSDIQLFIIEKTIT